MYGFSEINTSLHQTKYFLLLRSLRLGTEHHKKKFNVLGGILLDAQQTFIFFCRDMYL